MELSGIIALLSAITALLGYLQTRRKTSAEVAEAEARIRSALIQQIADLTERLNAALNDLNAAREEITRLRQENEDLRRHVQRLTLETESLRAANARLSARLAEMERENAALLRGVQRLVQQIRRHGLTPEWEPGQDAER